MEKEIVVGGVAGENGKTRFRGRKKDQCAIQNPALVRFAVVLKPCKRSCQDPCVAPDGSVRIEYPVSWPTLDGYSQLVDGVPGTRVMGIQQSDGCEQFALRHGRVPDLCTLRVDYHRLWHSALKLIDVHRRIEQKMWKGSGVVDERQLGEFATFQLREAATAPQSPEASANVVLRAQGRYPGRWTLCAN